MRKLILVILTVTLGVLTMAVPSSPYNGLIWYKNYTTFAAASNDIRFYGDFDGYLSSITYSKECVLYDDGAERTNINLELAMSCTNIGSNYYEFAVVQIYGNDKIKTIMAKINAGGRKFVFPKLAYSETDSDYSTVFIYYQ